MNRDINMNHVKTFLGAYSDALSQVEKGGFIETDKLEISEWSDEALELELAKRKLNNEITAWKEWAENDLSPKMESAGVDHLCMYVKNGKVSLNMESK